MRIADQLHLHTREEVVGILDDALAVVRELEPPEDLRPAVFTQAATMLGNKQVMMEQASMSPLLAPSLGRGGH